MKANRVKHNDATEYLAHHPEVLGLENVVESRLELDIKNHLGQQLTAIDVLYTLDNGLYIPLEYKCNDTVPGRLKAEEQLIIARQGILEMFGHTAQNMLYVHGRAPFGVEELVVKNDHYEWRHF